MGLKIKIIWLLSLLIEIVVGLGIFYPFNSDFDFELFLFSWFSLGVSGILFYMNFKLHFNEGTNLLENILSFCGGILFFMVTMFFFSFAAPMLTFPVSVLILVYTIIHIIYRIIRKK